MTQRHTWIAPTLSALAVGAWIALQPAAAQIPNAPGTPIGTPLGSPGAIDAPQMVQPVPPPASPSAQDPLDPPGRVGRLGEVTGQAWLYNPDSGDWISAERNRPLTTGDRLATDSGGRVEVHIGSTTLRLGADTEVEVERLDDRRLSLRLHSGTLSTRVRSQEVVREFELLTGEGRFTVQRTGRYRFDRNDEASHVTVYAGQARYEGTNSALTVYAGQRGEFWIDGQNVAQYSLTDPVRDEFAAWTAERDRADDRSVAQRYVSPEMTGVEDLDRYGSWQQNPEYGALWVPQVVSPGWAPYTTGRWVWMSPWGWTWVDEAPWGFAPFHYGRWVYVGSSWCWSPGTYVRRPVYAPALVAWIGGPRLSVSLSVGGAPAPAVGWVPLAPREVYVPGYRVSPRYVREVNITHVTNITNITTIVNNPQVAVSQQNFANRKFPHAVTVVPADVVAQRRPVAAIAQQFRDRPDVLRLTREQPRVAAIAAPPVTAPTAVARRIEGGGAPRGEPIPPPPGRVRAPGLTRPTPELRPNTLEGRPVGDAGGRAHGPAPAAIATPVAPTAPTAPVVRPAAPPTVAPVRPMPRDERGGPRERVDPSRGEAGAPDRQAVQVPGAQPQPQAQQLPPGRMRQLEQAREDQQARQQQAREQQTQRAQQMQEQQARQAQQAQMQRAQQAHEGQQVPPMAPAQRVQQVLRAQQAEQARAAEEARRPAPRAPQAERGKPAPERGEAPRGRD